MIYYIKIFGCQMNQSDAERIATYFEKYKIKPAASIDAADLIVFVTCGVRQSAEDRVYGQINNIRKKYPKKIIILTGCLAHRKDVRRRLKGKVELFCEIGTFPTEIKKILNTKYQIRDTRDKLLCEYLSIAPKHTSSHTAYIPIMTGCNNFCAYCVVPYARGREYSRPAEDILKEVKNLVKKGYKEIVLLGQNVNSFHDLLPSDEGRCSAKAEQRGAEKLTTPPPAPSSTEEGRIKEINFPKLLRLIEKIPGNFWLTFLTSHPKDMSDDLIETITKSKKICEYISLPAQSGDNEILRKMNRNYSIEHYKKLIKILKLSFRRSESLALGKLPPAVSTDIIVGFPGETKKQFENSAKILRELKFDMAYIAQYSPRPETAAWKLKDSISKKEKTRREKVLTEILSRTALENNKKYIGKIVEVLVDEKITNFSQKYIGHTRTQKKVIFNSSKKILVGSFVKIKITRAKAFGLEGNLL